MVEPQNPASPVRTLPPLPSSATQQTGGPRPASGGPSPQPQRGTQQQQRPAATVQAANRALANFSGAPFWSGVFLSIAWVGVVLAVMMQAGSAHTFGGIPLANWAIGISAVVAPVAMIWMVAAYLQRAADVQSVAEPLRRQLMMITGESGAAEVRVRRFNQAVKEQLDLLRSAQNASRNELTSIIESVRSHRSDMDQFEKRSAAMVRENQEIIRRSMQHVEQLMEDKFTMLRILDGKLAQSGEGVARQVDTVREQIGLLLQEVDSNSQIIANTLEKAMRDGRKLSDTAHAQETSLVGAAESAAGVLHDLSGRIDVNIARFLERASVAREEAERMASALDIQVRSLEEFGGVMPARIGEAEAVLRGVADRLYASEQMAREQAISLGEKLSAHVEDLQRILNSFGSSVMDADSGLQRRSGELGNVVDRASSTANDMVSRMERSIADMDERANVSLSRFSEASDMARVAADAVAASMTEAAQGYETVIKRMDGAANESGTKLREMSGAISAQLSQFEALREASGVAGADVQQKAADAMRDIREMLEGLAEAREATMAVGDVLSGSLKAAVEQNEAIVSRINDAAQMTVRAISIAAESLCRQESEITERSIASESLLRSAMDSVQERMKSTEAVMRERGAEITSIMGEVQDRLGEADARMKSFAADASEPVRRMIAEIEESSAEGVASMGRYGDEVEQQLSRLRQFNASVGEMGGDAAEKASETLSAMEQINGRFLAARAAQEDAARATMEQFAAIADKLHREVGLINDRAAEAVASLQIASSDVVTQAQQLGDEARETVGGLRLAASAITDESSQIRSVLQTQADGISSDIATAERQFAALGDSLRQKTEAAYAALDHVAARYNEVTRAAAEEFESKAKNLDQTASIAWGKMDALGASMAQQIGMIGSGTGQMDEQVSQLVAVSGKALQQLSALSEKMSLTQTATDSNAQMAIARLEDVNAAMLRQSAALSEASNTAVQTVQNAGEAFVEQAASLLSASGRAEQSVRDMSSSLAAFSERAGQVQEVMASNSGKLVSGLSEVIGQMDNASSKLREAATGAGLEADQTATRFEDMARRASSQLVVAGGDLSGLAARTETALSSLGENVSKQIETLVAISGQIETQHGKIASSGEAQRAQLVELFEKLGTAHGNASEVAERTMAQLNDALQHMQRNLSAMGDRSKTVLADVRDAGSGFADQAAMLLQNAQQAEHQARTMLSVTSAMREQVCQLRESLHGEGERTNEILGGLIGKLTTGNSELREFGSSAEITLTSILNGTSHQTEALSSLMQQISERQRSLTVSLDAQRDVLNGLLNRLTLAHDETSAVAERSATRLGDSSQQIVRQMEQLEQQAQSSMGSVRAAGVGFAEEAEALIKQAKQAEQQAGGMFERAAAFHVQSRQLREVLDADCSKTGELLSETLEKLRLAGENLRDSGATAEGVLNGVRAAVSERSVELSRSMQQVEERQRSLVSVLDVQKDAVGGILDRLSLAGDEAAAAAERSVSRISDGVQQIGKQAEAIEAKAQGAIVGIRSASSGFVDEAGTLGIHAQQLEQQVRGMMSVTSSMQEQARQLRESMQGDSSSVLESLSGVIARLDTACHHLRQQGTDTVNSFDQSVSEFSALAKDSGGNLQRQVENIATAAAAAEGKLGGMEDRIRAHLKIMNDAGDNTERQARQIADAAEYATGRLASLREAMTSGDREGKEALLNAGERISEIRETLSAELRRVAEISQEAVKSIAAASGDLEAQGDALRANLSSSESAVAHAAELMREDAMQLPSVLNRGLEQIESAGRALKEQSSEMGTAVVGVADRFITATGTVRETMMKELGNLGKVTDAANKALRCIVDDMVAQTNSIRQGSSMLSSDQAAMAEKASAAVDQLSIAHDKLSKLRGETAIMAEKLAREFGGIESRVGSTAQHLAAIGEGLGKQVAHLAAAAEGAEGKMASASQSFREQLERIRNGVQTQIDDINRGLMQITAQMERTSTSLRSASAGTVTDIEKISARFDQTSKEAAHQLTDRTARMRVATEEVGKLLNGFGDQMDVLLDRLSTAGDGIKRHESDLLGQLQSALGNLGTVVEKLEVGRNLTSEVGDKAVAKMAAAAEEVERQLRGLQEGADSVQGVVGGVGRMYAEHAGEMNRSVAEAQSQIISMNGSIGEMQQRADKMRASLKSQGDELLGSLEQILRQLSATGDAISDTVTDVLQQQAERNLERIG